MRCKLMLATSLRKRQRKVKVTQPFFENVGTENISGKGKLVIDLKRHFFDHINKQKFEMTIVDI